MKRSTLMLTLGLLAMGLMLYPVFAQADPGKNDGITLVQITEKIVIDGELSEAVWQNRPFIPELKVFFPIYGQAIDQETRVWAAYDRSSLYFAVQCLDAQANQVKATIAQRDRVDRDDFVLIKLDTLGSRQSAYEFYVNPRGIQMDGISSAVSGSNMDPDFVWHSAGKLIPQGYQVEVRIPLKSIRYPRGKELKMGFILIRSIPHLGIVASWPGKLPFENEFKYMTDMVYRDMKGGNLKLEVLPNFTYSRDSERISENRWDSVDDTDIGVGIKYGISSAVTAEATINPDFSQVESDAFQVEVNRRYPVFFSEKRPFFMESKEVLDFTIIKESMMVDPIHTRRIVDPGWAFKLSGSSGKLNFSLLSADDRSVGQPWDTGLNPNEGKSALFGIFRAKYNLGSDNMLGILYTGRTFAGEANNVAGLDLKYRLSKELRASFSYLQSATRDMEGDPWRAGGGLNAMLQYVSRRLISWMIYERYDSDFYMSTAFQNRVGISRGAFGIGPMFDMRIKGLPWLKRIIPFTHYYRNYDLVTKLTDIHREYAVNFTFSPMGELNLEYWDVDEGWAGQVLDKQYFHAVGYIQLVKWLFMYADIALGEQIYYHPLQPFVGDGKTISLSAILEPSKKVRLGLNYLRTDLETKDTGQKVYAVDIFNLETAYQFNRYFFLRGIVRYDNLQEKLLTDFLASFTLIPGTVVHLGYGSLYLRHQWQDGQWMPGLGELQEMKRGLFFKASYLWRFD